MNILQKLKIIRSDVAYAIDLYESVSEVHGTEAVEKLIEFVAETVGTDTQGTDLAIEVSKLVSFDGISDNCTLEVPSSEDVELAWSNGEWYVLDDSEEESSEPT